MKIGLYFCTCGTNITATVDSEKVIAELTASSRVVCGHGRVHLLSRRQIVSEGSSPR